MHVGVLRDGKAMEDALLLVWTHGANTFRVLHSA